MMRVRDVREIIGVLESAGIGVWLDGGWGVDALLGRQTRAHEDLDAVLALDALPEVRNALAALGFITWEDELPARLVLTDARGRRLDVHPVTFDAGGGGIQRLQNGSSFRYPPEGFHGVGCVDGWMVRCLSAATQLLCHTGYEPDEDDVRDVLALCHHFALPLPALYYERGVRLE